MTGQIVLRSSSSSVMNRRIPLLAGTLQSPAKSTPTRNRKKSKSNIGEVAGKTTADICVICCCCPCVVVEFLILAVKLPANVVRRMWKNRRQKELIKKNKTNESSGVLHHHNHRHYNQHHRKHVDESSEMNMKEYEMVKVSIDGAAEAAVELDNQMWERFRDAGFWRSPSRRHIMSN
ncbi:hypothetical protein RND81_05G257100 [Saponaria officinalis]|uniref:Uncharacterized protein n=1 Tax=Saponaria officinalis TaxID=3572 RepID=A0AAW1L2E4_SAPOF